MKIPKFTIVYNNGDVVHGGGEDDEVVMVAFSKKWLEAPSDGVSHVVGEDAGIGRAVLRQHEYYYQLPLNSHGKGSIGGSMKVGPFLRQAIDIGSPVKFGGWTGAATFYECANLANKDEWVPKQCGARRENQEDEAD